jgi:hypothetical protein
VLTLYLTPICLVLSILTSSISRAEAIDISLGRIGKGVLIDEDLFIEVDGAIQGIVPGSLWVTPGVSATIAARGLSPYSGVFLTATLIRTAHGYEIRPGTERSCGHHPRWELSSSGTHLSIVLNVEKEMEHCEFSGQALFGVPANRGKVTFASKPVGAFVYIPKPVSGFLVRPTPVTLLFDFDTGEKKHPVIFKMNGYFDCVAQITFEQEASSFFVVNNGRRIGVTTDDSLTAPLIECRMKKAPKGTLGNP